MNFSVRVFLAALALCAGLLGVRPARAQMDVAAPDAATARTLAAWYVHHVPARFRATSRLAVREMPSREMDAYLQISSHDDPHAGGDDAGDIDGVYESHPDRLALRLTTPQSLDMFTFAHEYGHYVWFHLFDDADRRRYEAVYKRQRDAGHLVTRYAQTDLEEGFAEAFSFYAAEPPMLAVRDPASFRFLTQWTPPLAPRDHPAL